MSEAMIRIRELAAWGLDQDEHRPGDWHGDVNAARASLARKEPYELKSAVLDSTNSWAQDRFAEQAERADLRSEMAGLDWSLGAVDIRNLLAFQRRIGFNSEPQDAPVPAADDWGGLMDLCFGNPKPIACDTVRSDASLLLRSVNPNLQFRFTDDRLHPVALHTASPFFEVAQYRDRWFLRDGYHRAFRCMQAKVFLLPAVIVRARTLAELGAVHPWFFSEKILFSSRPPLAIDFLDDALVIEYHRSPLIKTLRITVEETYSLQGENA
jgi:hypothetical protein